jgi:hypothetical protein
MKDSTFDFDERRTGLHKELVTQLARCVMRRRINVLATFVILLGGSSVFAKPAAAAEGSDPFCDQAWNCRETNACCIPDYCWVCSNEPVSCANGDCKIGW